LTSSVPKRIDAERSTSTTTSRFVSCTNRLTYSLSVRAKTFQSIWRMPSPGVYWRCSANSTARPWYGERCMPLITPSTIMRARSSNGASWASVSGARYCSARIDGRSAGCRGFATRNS